MEYFLHGFRNPYAFFAVEPIIYSGVVGAMSLYPKFMG